MNRLILFLFLIGSLFIFIGISNPQASKVKNIAEVKSSKEVGSPTSTPQNSPQESKSQVLITKVVDGDTVDVQIDNKKDVVRLIGINAPEKNQCFGKEATDKAKEILDSKKVSLESDPTQGDRDKYHRLLRYVFLLDGTNFDELMIKEGYALEYTYHTAYKYQSLFKSAQVEAQNNKRGLWVDGACSNFQTNSKATPVSSNSQNFACDCKKLCSQIATCEEAYFQLNQCGCTKRDSDGDGIPCESICK